MLNFLSGKLQKTINKISAKTTLTEENIQDALREVKLALLEADVNLVVIKKFINSSKEKALGSKVVGSLNPGQQMLKIFKEELIDILGENVKELNLKNNPSILMLVGLQGTGKTTSAAKICWYLRKKKLIQKPLLVAADIYRPAAIQQLVTLGKQIQVEVFEKGVNTKPQEIVKQALEYSRNNDFDFVLIDTAGRLAIDEALMQELKDIKQIAKPAEIILTVDALVGQDIINVAQIFNDNLKLTGTLVSKLDSDARAGASLSIIHMLSIPIQFIGTGEATSDIDIFSPERMAERILGMGDVYALIEKAQDVIDEKSSKKMVNRLVSGKFDLSDLLDNLHQFKKMGKFSKLISLIPGTQKITQEQIGSAEKKITLFEILISSMTKEERKNPRLLKNASRKKRIIIGSGRTNQEYNLLINEFERMQVQMKGMADQLKKGNFDPSKMNIS